MPKQRYHHPVIFDAKIDRIREGLGEDAAELFVYQPVGSCLCSNRLQLSVKSSRQFVANFFASLLIIPFDCLIKVVPNFGKYSKLLHPRFALTSARNCSSVSAREGSRSNLAQRESSSRFSASLTFGSFMDSPMDCHSASTICSFSLTGRAWSLLRSLAFMAKLSCSAAFLQHLSHPINPAL